MRRYNKSGSSNPRGSGSSSQQNVDSPPQQEGYRPTFDPVQYQSQLALQAWMQTQYPQPQYPQPQYQQPQYPQPQYPQPQYVCFSGVIKRLDGLFAKRRTRTQTADHGLGPWSERLIAWLYVAKEKLKLKYIYDNENTEERNIRWSGSIIAGDEDDVL
ncbi:hypothetical protein LXL04_013859 [Taraxacum kok-saghyz]